MGFHYTLDDLRRINMFTGSRANRNIATSIPRGEGEGEREKEKGRGRASSAKRRSPVAGGRSDVLV